MGNGYVNATGAGGMTKLCELALSRGIDFGTTVPGWVDVVVVVETGGATSFLGLS